MNKIIVPSVLERANTYLTTYSDETDVHLAVWGKVEGKDVIVEIPTGFHYDNIYISDDWFMAECRRRGLCYKCDDCSLRFKCWTQRSEE